MESNTIRKGVKGQNIGLFWTKENAKNKCHINKNDDIKCPYIFGLGQRGGYELKNREIGHYFLVALLNVTVKRFTTRKNNGGGDTE